MRDVARSIATRGCGAAFEPAVPQRLVERHRRGADGVVGGAVSVATRYRTRRQRLRPIATPRLGRTRCSCSSPRRSRLPRSEEHTSELQSLMRISYAVFCLKKKKKYNNNL